MSLNNHRPDEDGELGSLTDDLDQIRSDTTSFLKQRLVMWAVRWCIGFTIIWVVVSSWPNLDWLWWVGATVALASLAFLLLSRWLIFRRLDRTSSFIGQAKRKISEGARHQLGGHEGNLH
jgi:hypothetical protein